MPAPLLIGAAILGKGLLDFFGAKSRAESARERVRELRELNRQRRLEAERRLYSGVSRTAGDVMANARQAAMARAAALGRPQDASLMITPTEARIGAGASEAIQSGLGQNEQVYRAQESALDQAELGIENPNPLEFLGQGAGAALNYYVMDQVLEEMNPPLPELGVNPEMYGVYRYDNPYGYRDMGARQRAVLTRRRGR